MYKIESEENSVTNDLQWDHTPKIPSLTGIRGIAACWVVLFHFCTVLSSVSGVKWLGSVVIMRRGYLGVDLFFILSGFVLTLSYASLTRVESNRDGKTFLIGRIFRLFPLNCSVLLMLVVLVCLDPTAYWGPGPFTLKSLIASMTLTQGWFNMPSAWNYPAWSLSAEWFAYLLFAASYRRLKTPLTWRTALLKAVLCLIPFFAVLIAIRSTSVDHAECLGLLRCICEFFGGAMLCRSWRNRRYSAQFADKVFLAGCFCLLVGLVLPIFEPVVVFGFAALVFSCASSSPLSQAAFSRPFVLFLGDVSYSIYLTHAVILGTGLAIARSSLVQPLGLTCQFAVLTVALLVVIPLAYLTWRFVETPGQAVGRLWMRRTQFGFAALPHVVGVSASASDPARLP